VRKAGAPTLSALHTRDATRLRDVARRFVGAAEYLRGRPDPRDGREESARLRTSWLVAADAARSRQLGLTDIGTRLERTAAMIQP
jgi:hypothetical protein